MLGRFFAMLLERWKSKTPKGARIKQYIISGAGTAALIVLSIPSLGLPLMGFYSSWGSGCNFCVISTN